MEKKKCSSCKELKDISCFSYKNKEKKILQNKCKACVKSYCKRHYKQNKEAYKKRASVNNKIYEERNRQELIKYLQQHPCEKCNVQDIEVLDFHHKDQKEKEHHISYMLHGGFSWKTILKEINKCQVVCANCHRKIHNKLIGAYRSSV